MYQKIKKFAVYLMILTAILSVPTIGTSQNRAQDKEIRQEIRFARGTHSKIIRKQIRRGTSHTYTLRAKRGQRMQVVLTTRGETSFTVYSPSGVIDEADGVMDWVGDLTESGEYQITIGTDITANYTLEVAVK
jgi:hypothetical protein